MSSMDIIFAVFLAIFIFIGIWKGFFRVVLGLIGIAGGIVLGIVGFGPLSKEVTQLLPGIPAFILPFICFLFIFIGVYLSSRLLASILSRISSGIYLGWLNRLLGGIVGGLKGALLISLILMLAGFFPLQGALQNVRQKSLLYQPLQKLIPTLYNFSTGFNQSSKNLEKKITRTLKEGQVKLSEEMIKYFFYGKQDSSISK